MTNMNETKRTPVISAEVMENSGMVGEHELVLRCITGETLTISETMLSTAIQRMAIVHGLKQKLIDAAAISRDPNTGKSATPADKWAAVRAVYDRLLAGQWNAARGEGTGAGNGLLFRALVRLYPAKTADQLRAFLDGKTKAEQAALRANPKVSAIIEEIKAEQAKGGDVDTDALLDELED